MKNIPCFSQATCLTTILLAAVMFSTTAPLGAQTVGSARGGATRLLPSKPPAPSTTPAPAVCVKMCAMCQDRLVAITEQPTKGSQSVVKTAVRHACPACATSIVWTGHGKAKTREVIHTCSHRAGEHAENCATSVR